MKCNCGELNTSPIRLETFPDRYITEYYMVFLREVFSAFVEPFIIQIFIFIFCDPTKYKKC